jgi:hypothetical protein
VPDRAWVGSRLCPIRQQVGGSNGNDAFPALSPLRCGACGEDVRQERFDQSVDVGEADTARLDVSFLGGETDHGADEVVSCHSQQEILLQHLGRTRGKLLEAHGLLDGAKVGFHIPAAAKQLTLLRTAK